MRMTVLELVVGSEVGDQVLEIDDPVHIPCVGDFVDRKESGWRGYVTRRRFEIMPRGITFIRVWLDKDPP